MFASRLLRPVVAGARFDQIRARFDHPRLILSVVILYAFLRNWGTTFVAILVIPVTVLVTFLQCGSQA